MSSGLISSIWIILSFDVDSHVFILFFIFWNIFDASRRSPVDNSVNYPVSSPSQFYTWRGVLYSCTNTEAFRYCSSRWVHSGPRNTRLSSIFSPVFLAGSVDYRAPPCIKDVSRRAVAALSHDRAEKFCAWVLPARRPWTSHFLFINYCLAFFFAYVSSKSQKDVSIPDVWPKQLLLAIGKSILGEKARKSMTKQPREMVMT
jgi:hypothetical protein